MYVFERSCAHNWSASCWIASICGINDNMALIAASCQVLFIWITVLSFESFNSCGPNLLLSFANFSSVYPTQWAICKT